jgi:hypothetical protein
MRTRTRTTANSVVSWPSALYPWVRTDCSGNVLTGSSDPGARTVIKDSETETISDSLGKGKVNPVTHTRTRLQLDGGSGSRNFGSNVGGNFVYNVSYPTRPGVAEDVFAYAVSQGITSSWSSDISSINEQAMKNSVLDNAKALKADVLLNLVEANQVWPSLTSLTMSLPNMARNWNSLRKVIKTASGAFLAWKLGVSPILSDVMAINRYMPKMGVDLKRHGEGQKNRFSVSRMVNLSFTPGSVVAGGYFGSWPNSVISSQGRVFRTPTVRYVLVVEPTSHYMTGFFKKLDFVMRRFASSPASLLWEKIPFSFVADWFVDIRGSLNALDSALGFMPYRIVGFSRSYSYATAVDVFSDWYSPCTGAKIESMKAGTYEIESYERIPVQGGSLPTLSNRFGKNQAGISAALISQQLSKL